jgi:hypothetical protein
VNEPGDEKTQENKTQAKVNNFETGKINEIKLSWEKHIIISDFKD